MLNGGQLNGRLLNGGGHSLSIVTARGTALIAVQGAAASRLAEQGQGRATAVATVLAVESVTQAASVSIRSHGQAAGQQTHMAHAVGLIEGRMDLSIVKRHLAEATGSIRWQSKLDNVTIGLYPRVSIDTGYRAYAVRNGVHQIRAHSRILASTSASSDRTRQVAAHGLITGTVKGSALPGRGSSASGHIQTRGTVESVKKIIYRASGTARITGVGSGVRNVLPQTHMGIAVVGIANETRITPATGATVIDAVSSAVANRLYDGLGTGKVQASGTAEPVLLVYGYANASIATTGRSLARLNLDYPAPPQRRLYVPHSTRVMRVPADDRSMVVPGAYATMEA